MARNTDNKAFYYVGIARDSETYQMLLKDAREYSISVGKLLVLRAGDYYKSRGQAVTASQTMPAQQDDEIMQIEEDEFTQADRNADSALDAWG